MDNQNLTKCILMVCAIIVSILSIRCDQYNEVQMYIGSGLPDEDLTVKYIQFVNDREGYIFGTISKSSITDVRDFINVTDTVVNEAVVYGTTDGGKSWVIKDNIKNARFTQKGLLHGKTIYVGLASDTSRNVSWYTYHIDGITSELFEVGALWSIFVYDHAVYISTKNQKKRAVITPFAAMSKKDKEMYVETGDQVVCKEKTIFTIKSTSESDYLWKYRDTVATVIDMPIHSMMMSTKGDEGLIVAGVARDNENKIVVCNYDDRSNRVEQLAQFSDYTIVKGLQADRDNIVMFLGNIEGIFITYDLYYSRDNGKTWAKKQLLESNYVRAPCLIGDIVYIYSGMGQIQKVILS